MTKTIEEAAKSIAKDFIMENKGSINNSAPLLHECVQYAIEHIFAMPLSERMTAEEKERVRKMYKELSECIENRTADVEYLKGKRCQLVIIFGKELFVEE